MRTAFLTNRSVKLSLLLLQLCDGRWPGTLDVCRLSSWSVALMASLLLAWTTIVGDARAQASSAAPPSLSAEFSSLPTEAREPLIEWDDALAEPSIDALQNALSGDELQELLHGHIPASGLIQPAAPPGGPDQEDARPPPPASRLSELAKKVAPAVISFTAWDESGNELSRGCGCFINGSGAVLTDIQAVQPNAGSVAYITITSGFGAHSRVQGYWAADRASGIAVLQTDATNVPFLKLKPGFDFSEERAVSVVGLRERGLTLADAMAKADQSLAGEGWLNLRGEDSPGEPGSPVIDEEGCVVALISLRVPQGRWFNFGVGVAPAAALLGKGLSRDVRPLSSVERISPTAAVNDPRFLQAFSSLYYGRARTAVSGLNVLRKTYPRSAEVWALLGLAAAKLGAKAEALNCNRKAVALDPHIGQYWYQLALNHLSEVKGANPAALEALEQTVELQPRVPAGWILLAEQRIAAKEYREAEAALMEAIKLQPGYPRAFFLLAYVHGRQEKYPEADAAIQRCLKLDRTQDGAWYYLGLLEIKRRRYPEAVQAFNEVVRLQPKHPHAWLNLAQAQRRLGRDTEAQLALDRHRGNAAGKR